MSYLDTFTRSMVKRIKRLRSSTHHHDAIRADGMQDCLDELMIARGEAAMKRMLKRQDKREKRT